MSTSPDRRGSVGWNGEGRPSGRSRDGCRPVRLDSVETPATYVSPPCLGRFKVFVTPSCCHPGGVVGAGRAPLVRVRCTSCTRIHRGQGG